MAAPRSRLTPLLQKLRHPCTRSQHLQLTPREIVAELDRYIIGQHAAKRAVAIALRNRWRRMQLDPALRDEVMPKNILMIGPTGVGKTEIARRLAALANAPFVKVEATRFTEVGYVGKDVEQIIRDLADAAVKMFREQAKAARAHAGRGTRRGPHPRCAVAQARRRRLRLRPASDHHGRHRASRRRRNDDPRRSCATSCAPANWTTARSNSSSPRNVGVDIMTPPGMEEMGQQLRAMFQNLGGGKTQKRTLTVKAARPLLVEEEAGKLVNEDEIRAAGHHRLRAERHRLHRRDRQGLQAQRRHGGGDVTREGVQRDLLPLVEGSTVSTKYGVVRTDHILFIASGAFHLAKPQRPDPGVAGPLPDPRRTHRARPRTTSCASSPSRRPR